MSAHTPMRQGFNAAHGSRYVFVPGCAKPINAGSVDRAAFIVRACNAHDDLVAAVIHDAELRAIGNGEPAEKWSGYTTAIGRAALAKAGAA